MKTEKLNLMLNKVVRFTKTTKKSKLKFEQLLFDYRGFLQKDGDRYYIKLIEVVYEDSSVTNKYSVKDNLYLTNGDEEFLTIPSKPKLMKVSKKSWHYGLVKYVLQDSTPTPKTMQSGCPYFWLLLFSMFAAPFKLIGTWLIKLFLLPFTIIQWGLEKLVDAWIFSIDDETAYDLSNVSFKESPITAKIFYKNRDFFSHYMEKKYEIKCWTPEYNEKRKEICDKWEVFMTERRKRNEELYEEQLVREKKQAERRRISDEKWNRILKPIEDGITKIFTSIKKVTKYFTIERSKLNNIIKITKQIVGTIITLSILMVGFYAIIGLTYIITMFIDFSITYWYIYAAIGIIGLACFMCYILYVVVWSWIQGIVGKYKKGRKIWYVEPFIYLIYYPLKAIVYSIAYLVLYVLWHPFKFIFFTILWKLILVNLGLFIWKCLVSLARGILGSTGIFGEYVGADFSNYCPGLEWIGFNENE